MRRYMLLALVATFLVVTLPGKAEESVLEPDAATQVVPSSTPAWDTARTWITAFMIKNAPPGRPTYFEQARESKDEALERYNEIADAIIEAVYDPNQKAMFSGPTGRSRTASLLLGIMLWETGFRRDVDYGLGKYGRGDHGKSWCLMQIQIGDGKTQSWNTKVGRAAKPGDDPDDIQVGHSGPELISNRSLCIAEGMRIVRTSFGSCRTQPLEYRLSAYASGSCDKGQEKSRQRVGTGMSWFQNSKNLRTFKDADLVQEVTEFQKHKAQQDQENVAQVQTHPQQG